MLLPMVSYFKNLRKIVLGSEKEYMEAVWVLPAKWHSQSTQIGPDWLRYLTSK